MKIIARKLNTKSLMDVKAGQLFRFEFDREFSGGCVSKNEILMLCDCVSNNTYYIVSLENGSVYEALPNGEAAIANADKIWRGEDYKVILTDCELIEI